MTERLLDSGDVLAANASFYRAFSAGDAEAMERLWSRESPVSCLHPGWPIVLGRQRVMASWRAILRRPPPVRCREPRVLPYGHLMLVVCCEIIESGMLAASNLFVREDGGWHLVHHQACPYAKEVVESIGGEGESAPRAIH